MSARAAKNARLNADMEQKAREVLLEVEISRIKHAGIRPELSRKAPRPNAAKAGLSDNIDKAFDIADHFIERVNRMADRFGKTKGADQDSGSASGDEPPAKLDDGAAQPDAGGG